MFGANVVRAQIGALLGNYGLSDRQADMPLQVMLIETAGVRVLIDTGMGDMTFHGNEEDNGRLVRSPAVLGLTTDDIAFEFWTHPPNRAPAAFREMIAECRRHLLPVAHGLQRYSDGDELAPGLFAVAAPGHTYGHCALRLESGGKNLLPLVDTAVHYIANLEHPDWTVGADLKKPLAVQTRRRLLAQAAEEQILVAVYHFPFPGVGMIRRLGDGFRYVPVPLV